MKVNENKYKYQVSSEVIDQEADLPTEKQLVPSSFSLQASNQEAKQENARIQSKEKERAPFSLQTIDDNARSSDFLPNRNPAFALPISDLQKENSLSSQAFVIQQKENSTESTTPTQASRFQHERKVNFQESDMKKPYSLTHH